jgi:predicted esterase YcpF (UPF0227 family)
MDKKTMEECLQLYPKIDEEIKRHEDNIKYYKDNKNSMIKDGLDDICSGVIESIDLALKMDSSELENLYEAKAKVSYVFPRLSLIDKKIIEIRFWKNPYELTKWKEVADEIKYNRCTIERKYKKILEKILDS